MRLVGVFAKVQKVPVTFIMAVCQCVCLSVGCLHGTDWLPLDGFSWNLIFDYFSKVCQENSAFITI